MKFNKCVFVCISFFVCSAFMQNLSAEPSSRKVHADKKIQQNSSLSLWYTKPAGIKQDSIQFNDVSGCKFSSEKDKGGYFLTTFQVRKNKIYKIIADI